MDKFNEEGKLLTDVYRERQADLEFDKMAQAEIEEKLREQGIANSFGTKKRGRFFWKRFSLVGFKIWKLKTPKLPY